MSWPDLSFSLRKLSNFAEYVSTSMLDTTPLKKLLDQARVLEHVYQSNHADVRNRNNPEGKFLLYQITKTNKCTGTNGLNCPGRNTHQASLSSRSITAETASKSDQTTPNTHRSFITASKVPLIMAVSPADHRSKHDIKVIISMPVSALVASTRSKPGDVSAEKVCMSCYTV